MVLDPECGPSPTPEPPKVKTGITVYLCESCEKIFEEDDMCGGKLYECGDCGMQICSECDGTRRCETCNKFAARADQQFHCPDCGVNGEELLGLDAIQYGIAIYVSLEEVREAR